MNLNSQSARVIALAGALCAGLITWAYLHSPAQIYDATALVQTLPPDQAVHLYVDFAILRRSGLLDLLAGSKASEDADYRRFVDEAGFDYRTDLDAAALAFRNGSVYMAVRGRIDWDRLQKYATSHGGRCQDSMCGMPASTPGRTISYYQLQPGGILALAVSPDERGASMVGPLHWKTPPRVSNAGLWLSTPPFVFQDVKSLPAGSHSFLSPLADTQGVTFSLGPGPRGLSEASNLELRMEASSVSPEKATELAKHLTDTTSLLAKMLSRDKMKPSPGDLSSVLVAGKFVAKDLAVTGAWPIDRQFVEGLLKR